MNIDLWEFNEACVWNKNRTAHDILYSLIDDNWLYEHRIDVLVSEAELN